MAESFSGTGPFRKEAHFTNASDLEKIDHEIDRKKLLPLLGRELRSLPPREQRVIRLLYGLEHSESDQVMIGDDVDSFFPNDPMSPKEVANIMGLSEDWIIRLEMQILERLRRSKHVRQTESLLPGSGGRLDGRTEHERENVKFFGPRRKL